MDKKKRQIKYFWRLLQIGSFILGIAIAYFKLDATYSGIIVSTWFCILVLLFISLYMSMYHRINENLAKINTILYVDLDADLYIDKINELFKGLKSRNLKNVKYMNLGAAYCYKRNYEAAKESFLMVNSKYLNRDYKIMYWADLTFVYFNLGADDQAFKTIEDHNLLIENVSKIPGLDSLIEMLRIYTLLRKNNISEAEDLYEFTRAKYENNFNTQDFDAIYDEIQLKKENYI